MQPSVIARMRPTQYLGIAKTNVLSAQNVTKQQAHTITKRYSLSKLKNVPPELMPLGLVILFGIGAAGFAIFHKFATDRSVSIIRTSSIIIDGLVAPLPRSQKGTALKSALCVGDDGPGLRLRLLGY